MECWAICSWSFMTLSFPSKTHILKKPPTMFNKMFANSSISPPSTLTQETPLISLIETCESMHQLKQIHSQTIKLGLLTNPTVQNKLVTFCCSEKGDLKYECKVFRKITQPSVFLWNTMIKGYSRIDSHKNGVLMYLDMLKSDVRPDKYTFPFLFKGFTREIAGSLERSCIVMRWNLGLISTYCLCGEVDMARGIFYMSFEDDDGLHELFRIKAVDDDLHELCPVYLVQMLAMPHFYGRRAWGHYKISGATRRDPSCWKSWRRNPSGRTPSWTFARWHVSYF